VNDRGVVEQGLLPGRKDAPPARHMPLPNVASEVIWRRGRFAEPTRPWDCGVPLTDGPPHFRGRLSQDPPKKIGAKEMNQFLRARDAAVYLGISAQTLAKWRLIGDRIPFSRIGRSIVCDVADLDAYVADNRRRSTSDSGAEKATRTLRARPAYASGAQVAALEARVNALVNRLQAVEEFLGGLRFLAVH